MKFIKLKKHLKAQKPLQKKRKTLKSSQNIIQDFRINL